MFLCVWKMLIVCKNFLFIDKKVATFMCVYVCVWKMLTVYKNFLFINKKVNDKWKRY